MKISSRSLDADRIESICDLICATSHLREMQDGGEEIGELYQTVLDLRRELMSELLKRAKQPNLKYHCVTKHLLGAWWRAVEVYEQTLDTKDYDLAKRLGDVAAEALSQYLGMERATCSRCLLDMLQVEDFEKEGQQDA